MIEVEGLPKRFHDFVFPLVSYGDYGEFPGLSISRKWGSLVHNDGRCR